MCNCKSMYISSYQDWANLIFLAFDFCGFSVFIRCFFITATTANDLPLRRIFYPRFYQVHLFSYLNSWERASIFPFECSVLNKGTTGNIFLLRLWYDAVLDWGLNPGPQALEASTLPLGYRGSGFYLQLLHNNKSNVSLYVSTYAKRKVAPLF